VKFTVPPGFDNTYPFQYLAGQLESIHDVYKEMISECVGIIDLKQKELDNKIRELRKIDQEEADIFNQHDYEPGRIKNIKMKEAIFQSSLIYLYSQFESALFEIVRICEKDLDFKQFTQYQDECKKFRKGIWKAIKYIELSSKINLQDIEIDWNQLDYFRQIRNTMVHRSGVLYMDDLKIQEYISNHPHLELFTVRGANNSIIRYQVIISEEYTNYISDLLMRYLINLMDRIWKKHYSGK
jgi:hypothetical protein